MAERRPLQQQEHLAYTLTCWHPGSAKALNALAYPQIQIHMHAAQTCLSAAAALAPAAPALPAALPMLGPRVCYPAPTRWSGLGCGSAPVGASPPGYSGRCVSGWVASAQPLTPPASELPGPGSPRWTGAPWRAQQRAALRPVSQGQRAHCQRARVPGPPLLAAPLSCRRPRCRWGWA